jgi:hypothetical protein
MTIPESQSWFPQILSRIWPFRRRRAPRVRLLLQRTANVRVEPPFPVPSVPPTVIYLERIRALLRIGKLGVTQDCIVDTGAPITIFPEKEWRRFASEIVWLTTPQGVTLPRWLTVVCGMTGGSFMCRPGAIEVQIIDLDGRSLLPSTLVCLFTSDAGRLKNIILGLDGGTLSGRRCEIQYDARLAWLVQS